MTIIARTAKSVKSTGSAMLRRQSARLSTRRQQDNNTQTPANGSLIEKTRPASRKQTKNSRVSGDGIGETATKVSKKRKTPSTSTSPHVLAKPKAKSESGTKLKRSDDWQTKPPAELNVTNAVLQTPKGTRVVPTKVSMPLQIGTSGDLFSREIPAQNETQSLLERARSHLIQADPNLRSVLDQHPCHMFSPKGLLEVIEPFETLVKGICAQQVSGAAANSIKNKFVALFNDDSPSDHVFPTPDQVADTDITVLRSAGLSQRKAEYIKGLAEKFTSGELSAQILADASDEELLNKLVSVRGLGRWSAEMFASFALKRTDIFSTGDLGVQRGVAAYLGRDVAKLKNKGGKWKYASEKEMLDVSAKFSPYRTLFMWLMWRIEDTDTSVLE